MPIYDDTMARAGGATPGAGAAASPGAGAATDPVEFDPFLPELDESAFDSIFAKTVGTTKHSQDLSVDRGPAMHADSSKASQITALARSFLGTPYKWGGNSPSGFDCSGFVQYVYAQMGIKLPRISNQQATAGTLIGLGSLKAGDLVAWNNSVRNNGADHIAIYLGGGLIAEAPKPGVPLRIRKLDPQGYDKGAWGTRVL